MAQDAPQKIGKYEILELLGRGGMGVVYKARDPVIDRVVAIKTITVSGSIDEADLLQRLKMEARSAGRLHHPNIVTVFDFGEEGGVPYIVMEYAEGVDLAQFIESGQQLSLPKKLDILIGTCQGLAFAHELGVIHRDMKPSNVRLTTKNVPKILDFGLARFDTTRLTRTGFMSGTIAYMSPERINGQTGASDDIFAMGTIAYELLTYRRAFPGSTPPEVMMKIITQSPPAPSTVAEVPQGLDAIIAKCMAREVSERYSGAREFADVLHDFERSEELSQFLVSENRSTEFRSVYESWTEETEQRPRSDGAMRRRTSQTTIPTLARPVSGTQAKGFETVPGSQSPDPGATIVTPTSGTRSQGTPATILTPTASDSAATTIERATRPRGSAQDPTVLAASPAGAASPTVVVPSGRVADTPGRKRLVLSIAAAVLVAVAGLVAVALNRSAPPPDASPTTSAAPPANITAPTPQQRAVESNPVLSSPVRVPTETIAVTASAAQKREEVAELVRRIDSKLINAAREGVRLPSKQRSSLEQRVAQLKLRMDRDDEATVRRESAAILDAYDEAILAAVRRPSVAPPQTTSAAPSRTEPGPRVPAAPGPVAVPASDPPAPRPAEPSRSDTKAEVVSFVGKIGNAFQNRDVAFFRQHDVRFNDAMERAIRGSPSIRVDFEVLTVEIIDPTHARVTVKRTDIFADRNVPPGVQRLNMSLRRERDDWKIESSQRLQ